MPEPTVCCRVRGGYCARCDLLVGLPGLHVIDVDRDDGGALTITVESTPDPMGCPTCGVIAQGHGRREVRLVDAPAFGKPATVVWRKHRWRCPEPVCPVGVFDEQDEAIARARGLLTVRACWWAIGELRREHAGQVPGSGCSYCCQAASGGLICSRTAVARASSSGSARVPISSRRSRW